MRNPTVLYILFSALLVLTFAGKPLFLAVKSLWQQPGTAVELQAAAPLDQTGGRRADGLAE